ncbi:MAG: T9SS type A sorting domain-containing protein, partial [Bacteroidota bacterium]
GQPFSLNTDALAIYPNPATEQITINLPNPEKASVYLDVYDIGGKRIFSQQYTGAVNQSLEVSSWRRGLYVAKLRTQFSEVSKKFVVQ